MLFTCPSRYSSTIGHTGVFSLGGWSPQLHATFLDIMALLRNTARPRTSHSVTGLSPSRALHSRRLHFASRDPSAGPTTPTPQGDRFGLDPFRSPLLRTSRLISLPPGTEMFQFPGFALHIGVTGVPAGRVSPFGHPGLIARVQLPPAYRSLPRPSSPPCAQASPTGLLSLDYTCSKQNTRSVEAHERFARPSFSRVILFVAPPSHGLTPRRW